MEETKYCHECSFICEIEYCEKINKSCCGSPDNFIYLCDDCRSQYGVSVACDLCCAEACCNNCCKFITDIEKSDEEISKIDNILKEKINIPDLRNIIHEYSKVNVKHYTVYQTDYTHRMYIRYKRGDEPYGDLINDNVIYILDDDLYKISDNEKEIEYLNSIIGGHYGFFVTKGIINNSKKLVFKYDYCGGNCCHPASYKKEIFYNDDENTHYIIHNYYYDTESG